MDEAGLVARSTEPRKRVYLWCLGSVAPLLPLVGWFNRDEAFAVPVYTTLTLVIVGAFLGLLRGRVSLAQAEVLVVGAVSAVILSRLAAVALWDPVPLRELRRLTVETIGPTLTAMILVIHLAFDERRARVWSLGLWAAFSGILALRLLDDPSTASSPVVIAIARQSMVIAVVAGLAYAMASLKTQLVEARARSFELHDLATTDVLTGARNRRGVEAVLRLQLAQLERYGGQLSIAMFDLDHFKARNDHHGHAAGDEALVDVVATLRTELRATDALARWGGDELLIVAPEIGVSEVARSAERWRTLVADLALCAGVGVVTTSIGVATYRPGDTLDDLLQRADRALYVAKASGGDRVVSDVEVEAAAGTRPSVDPGYVAVVHDVTDPVTDPMSDPVTDHVTDPMTVAGDGGPLTHA